MRRYIEDGQAKTVTTVVFQTCTQDGCQVSGQFILRVTHKLDESKLAELLARYGLATVFEAVNGNSLVTNGKSEQGL